MSAQPTLLGSEPALGEPDGGGLMRRAHDLELQRAVQEQMRIAFALLLVGLLF